MFNDATLQQHLKQSSSINTDSAIIAEWNMNESSNIALVGNYRYRPYDNKTGKASIYSTLLNVFDSNDSGNFYTGATDSDVFVDGGVQSLEDEQNTPIPVSFISKNQKEKLLYSLDECFGKFRPRSGINKLKYFDQNYSHFSNINMVSRPRYYMAHKDDKFKYWSSFRTEGIDYNSYLTNTQTGAPILDAAGNQIYKDVNVERGIAKNVLNGKYYIDDTAPFVVYKNSVPANRVVVKMQTNTGTVDLGPFSNLSGSFADPFYGFANQTTPIRWRIQKLQGSSWTDIITFDESSLDENGNQVIGPDGYVQIDFGLIIPKEYKDTFMYMGEILSETLLPAVAKNGYAFLVKTSTTDVGVFHVWNSSLATPGYETFVPQYGWYLGSQTIERNTSYVTDLTAPEQYFNPFTQGYSYREFDYVGGLRVAVETMNKIDSTFDLIELSPRLAVNITDKVQEVSVTKSASDIGVSGLPVGQLLAATGSIKIFDYDQAFSSENTTSIISKYITSNIQFKIFEIVKNVGIYDYYIPVKTMYSEGFPEITNKDRTVSINLRDMFFYIESLTAPQILVENVSLSYAVSLLFDAIGFSNYVFKRNAGENDPIIPHFFIGPDRTVAQILEDLAVSTQTAMFFDEYNNFVMMSKDYIMPSSTDRKTDVTLYATEDGSGNLANIEEISSQDNSVYNDGKIVYTSRYIQKQIGSIQQASMVNKDLTWIYKPVLLWEVSPSQNPKAVNDETTTSGGYALSAIVLNSDLSDAVPQVANGVLVNNTIDLGESVINLGRYNGYFYANGEIIHFDAVQYSVSGVGIVWISSVEEYENYFSKITFNGKMYATGLIRIYSQPYYETFDGITTIKNGSVVKHGRGQFGTDIVYHSAGLNPYWSDNANTRGCDMNTTYLLGSSVASSYKQNSAAGQGSGNNSYAQQSSTRNGIIRNFLSSTFLKESITNRMTSAQTGTIQSSALVFNGPPNAGIGFVSYVYKTLPNSFKHFGTRMRIIGTINNNEISGQTPFGSSSYYSISNAATNENINVGGASGGVAVMIDPNTNNGYYFEIAALTENNINNYNGNADIANMFFYKVVSDGTTNGKTNQAIPVKLWSGLAPVIVDDGLYTGQYRMTTEENPTVYDLAVEYETVGSSIKFYLYVNGQNIATVVDSKPLNNLPNMAVFVRGGARCMFENVYAVGANYAQNSASKIDAPTKTVFDSSELNLTDAFQKYAMSGIIQSTYLSGISTSQPPKYNFYFDEFGTIMREAAYMNIRYDKAYPALYAKISPTFNRIKGYTISGFTAGSYGAEFLIFNATDTTLALDDTSGNYLRIQGVTFTQQSQHELTVDDYFVQKSNLSDPEFITSTTVVSPNKVLQDYSSIKQSRATYGKKEFSLDAAYIQTQDAANGLMKWMISKIMKPRKAVGLSVFGMPTIQLGDIVEINYKDENNLNPVSDSRFVVYSIEYSKSDSGPETKIYLSEVL